MRLRIYFALPSVKQYYYFQNKLKTWNKNNKAIVYDSADDKYDG